jgi:hypothetical protein
MDDAHGPPEGQQEIHDAFQAYHTHEGYLDPAQAQAIANYMPDFAGMDPASQAAAMQQYHPDMATGAEGQERGNIDDRCGWVTCPYWLIYSIRDNFSISTNIVTIFCLLILLSAAQQRLTIATADSQATKGDEAWTEEEERELLRIVNDEEYRKVRCRLEIFLGNVMRVGLSWYK